MKSTRFKALFIIFFSYHKLRFVYVYVKRLRRRNTFDVDVRRSTSNVDEFNAAVGAEYVSFRAFFASRAYYVL